uniref:39S ribosomal protein L39, mitochondrial-like n=1 Tax=Dermatophagoides pteronyssinus TaxID=6956 RepID=A0A6P6Y2T4_DERPT|nr:39S ribosomal protein L39, mitochondrial-like [Dermatophagoides pteronyssinus]
MDKSNRLKNELFDEEKQRQQSLITRFEKIEVNLEKPFPDGEDYVLMMNANISTPHECANHIHQILKQRSALALVNGNEYWDMHRPLVQSCNLTLLHFKHDDCMPVNYAFWRSCSMLLASVIPKAFRDEYKVHIISKPVADLTGGSFICDVEVENLTDWKPTSQEIQSITSLLWDETVKAHRYERIQVSAEVASKLFADNFHRLSELEKLTEQDANRQFTIYRCGQYIELSDGPMIADTSQIGFIYLSAIHPLKKKDGSRFYRFQGIAMPKQLNINPFAFSLIRDRSKRLKSNIIPKDSNIKNKSSSSSINENSSGNHNNKLEKRINDIEKEKIMDELFYDPDEDDSNQQWMDRKKFLYESRIKSSSSSDTNVNKNVDDDEQRKRKLQSETKLKKPRTNDATLNCPCCLSLLCLDCQRHEIYKTQYRAMFVQNCRIDYGKKLFIKNKDEIRKRFQKRKKRQQQSEQQESENEHSFSTLTTNDQYYPVHCNICNTQVAVYDLDEVYHFFSVIASH